MGVNLAKKFSAVSKKKMNIFMKFNKFVKSNDNDNKLLAKRRLQQNDEKEIRDDFVDKAAKIEASSPKKHLSAFTQIK